MSLFTRLGAKSRTLCPNRTHPLADSYWYIHSDGFSTIPLSLCSAYTVLKFMMMWTLVLLADFILEFRLEYLWPCWLFFGSVYTTFHCHGLVRNPAVWFHLVWSGPDDDNPTEWIQCIFTDISVFFVCRLSVLFLSVLPSLWTSFV